MYACVCVCVCVCVFGDADGIPSRQRYKLAVARKSGEKDAKKEERTASDAAAAACLIKSKLERLADSKRQITQPSNIKSNLEVADASPWEPHNAHGAVPLGNAYAELEINDFSVDDRQVICSATKLMEASCGVAITQKGMYIKPGDNPRPGHRKLYLLIEGDDDRKVQNALNRLKMLRQV